MGVRDGAVVLEQLTNVVEHARRSGFTPTLELRGLQKKLSVSKQIGKQANKWTLAKVRDTK